MKTQRLIVNVPLPFDYQEAGPELAHAKELILFLHGYEQKGQTLIQRLLPACPPQAKIIAPNAPFPIPRRTETGFKVGYSWYFHDPIQNEYFIDMGTATQAILQAVAALGLTDIPKRIVGFSQGGYFAPFLALALKNVKQVVGIGCDYLLDELPAQLNFRWDGIHGSQDEIVDCSGALRSHSRLANLGVAGKFHVLEGTGHEMNEAVVKTLKSLL